MRLSGLLCLGLGAGLTGGDMRHVRGVDVAWRHGGMVVQVAGSRPRVVPVVGDYHQRLAAAAAFAGDGYLTGGVSPARHNVTNHVVAKVAGSADGCRLDIARMRSTWLATHIAALGIPALFAAAGVRDSHHIGALAAAMPTVEEAAMVALLGGVAR
jgi:hypothetical protein